MSNPNFGRCKSKGADQLCSNCTADQRHGSSSTCTQNFKVLAFFCGCIGWFVSDLVEYPEDRPGIHCMLSRCNCVLYLTSVDSYSDSGQQGKRQN